MSERMYHLQALQQISQRVFEGRPCVCLRGDSLPPPADKPKKVKKALSQVDAQQALKRPHLATTRAQEGLELRARPDGQMCWQTPLVVVEQAQALLRTGVGVADLARELDVSDMAVYKIKRQMIQAGELLPQIKSGPRPRAQAQAQPQPMINNMDAQELRKHGSRGGTRKGQVLIDRAPVAEAGFAAPSTPLANVVPNPTPPAPGKPACPPAPYTPPPRPFYVLDWKRRMDGYSYTQAPAGVLPRKSKHAKRRGSALTHAQIKDEWNTHQQGTGKINPKHDHPVDPFVD